MVRNVFRYLEPFTRGSLVWRTDGRTDRKAFSNGALFRDVPW